MSAEHSFHPIGTVHSPWLRPEGVPVQAFIARHAEKGWPGGEADRIGSPFTDTRGGRGTLEVLEAWRDALDDLDGFSHLWALSWIDRAKPATPRVLPYRDTQERGLFATRAPARPNPIGLSCLEIVSVVGRFVHVVGLDLLHGTPLLDIKPYVPDYDSFRAARRGWLEDATSREDVTTSDDRFFRGK